MAQRISRAKQSIKASAVPFRMPAGEEQEASRRSVLHVLYLIFNEGYTSSTGRALLRAELSDEAIRLTRMVRRLLPDDGEVMGLLALMLLIDARRPARTDADGELIPLAEQDRTLWDRALIAEGTELVDLALGPRRGRRVPAPGRDRRRARPRRNRGRHRLAADPRPLRVAGSDDGQPDRDAQPRRRGGDGREPGCGPGPARHGRRVARGALPPRRGAGAPARARRATRRRRRRTTGWRPSGRRARRSGASWRCRRRGSTPAPTTPA